MNCKYYESEGCTRPPKYQNDTICQTHYNREWRQNNPEKFKAQKKAYYEKNKEKIKERNLAWREANIEFVRANQRAFMARNAKNPVTEEHMTDKVKQRFFDKVDKTPNCWIWLGAKSAWRPKRRIAGPTQGYGVININNRPFYVHRASWLMHKGPLIPGLVIDHLCNNTLCVNPDHLQQVTNMENSMRSPKHSSNTTYKYYRTHCKYGHERPVESRNKNCPTCYQEMLAKRRKSKYPKGYCKNGHNRQGAKGTCPSCYQEMLAKNRKGKWRKHQQTI